MPSPIWRRFFGVVADSSQLGIFKPEPGIFDHALKRLGSIPSETAMVGDSLAKDCAPAHRLGITTIWLRHAPLSDAARLQYSAIAQTGDLIGDARVIERRSPRPDRPPDRPTDDEIAGTEQSQLTSGFTADFTIEGVEELEHLNWWRS